MEINKTTEIIIGCAIEVHKHLGSGLLESTYEACLCYELINAGVHVQCQIPMPLIYKEVRLEQGYRIDMLVENCIVLELKAVEAVSAVHLAQTLTF